MVKRLDEIGLASRSYTEAIALLSSRMEEVEQLDKILREKGCFYKSGSLVKEHPAVRSRERAARHVQSLFTEFGLTPASIQKIGGLKKKPKKNDFEDF